MKQFWDWHHLKTTKKKQQEEEETAAYVCEELCRNIVVKINVAGEIRGCFWFIGISSGFLRAPTNGNDAGGLLL